MAFSASMAELAAVSALKAVYGFLQAMPPHERYTATGIIGGRASDAASLRKQAFWTLAHQLADASLVGKNAQKLSEQILSLLLADADLLASIAAAITSYECEPRGSVGPQNGPNSGPPVQVGPVIARQRVRPSARLGG